ncbi:MAG: CocE/NonD family hydrolase [Thiohalophilus sp.]|uniref:CocE/NonD family hydrolase n=1 Tax=Thiohalophilus sp. TaxID=3028392 RepID=UPI00286FB930|nr:CocE/NonD family hydrolase [Thiohalophilus sp.]MDR9437296.1 CocE/NonD family hydrolase [Thiohalophilus sp.]
MRIVNEFPHKVKTIENVWIPMPDGIHLAARLWLPDDAEQEPVPAVLEYIPYRKRDSVRARDEQIYPYFAGHGYAGIRVDLRGSGDSEGVLRDEYLQQELDDGVAILQWLEDQPWCNGNVGMMGISWGGFNGLQIAAMRPPQLKAVITASSTDDRYADDVHHMGGCLLGDNLSWASTMFAYNSCPPDPEVVGDNWRDMWFERLRGSGLWLEQWLQHQRRDDYWKHGSICEDYADVQCPVMAVSGWADGYSNAVFRLLENLSGPRSGLIGPWSHKYPHIGQPGPAIGFLQEAVRWWDKWLKGLDNGVDKDPMLRVWMQDSVPPTTRYQMRPGRWVAENDWPTAEIEQREFILAPARQLLPADETSGEETRNLQSPLGLGLFAGKWCSYAAAPDLPHDQRQEDGGALVFDSEPLAEPLEILGAPVVELEVIPDKPVAMLAVRLSDIAPDNKAARVTYGLLNLTHRDDSEHPQSLQPGKQYRVRVQLNNIAQHFPAGHRLRIAVSTSYWPLAWPAPESTQVKVIAGISRAFLPVRTPRDSDNNLRPFDEPEAAPPLDTEMIEPEHHNWRVIRDLDLDLSTLKVINDSGIVYIRDIDLEMGRKALEWYTYQGDDFNSVRGETLWERSYKRGDWFVKTITRTVLTSTASDFYLRAELDAYEGDKRVYSANWDTVIPRDFV